MDDPCEGALQKNFFLLISEEGRLMWLDVPAVGAVAALLTLIELLDALVDGPVGAPPGGGCGLMMMIPSLVLFVALMFCSCRICSSSSRTSTVGLVARGGESGVPRFARLDTFEPVLDPMYELRSPSNRFASSTLIGESSLLAVKPEEGWWCAWNWACFCCCCRIWQQVSRLRRNAFRSWYSCSELAGIVIEIPPIEPHEL